MAAPLDLAARMRALSDAAGDIGPDGIGPGGIGPGGIAPGGDDLAARKAALRVRARERLGLCDPRFGVALAKHVIHACPPPPGAIVAGFWPLPHEIDIRPLLHALATVSFEIVLPVTPAPGRSLSFRKWNVDDALLAGRHDTRHTQGQEMIPTFILVPLLAFDTAGNRLGHGAGYYDRSFAALPHAFRLGCGFAAQEFDRVPAGIHDVRLHAIATEAGVRHCGAVPPAADPPPHPTARDAV